MEWVSFYLILSQHVNEGVHTCKDMHMQAVATGRSYSPSPKVTPVLQVLNGDSSAITLECRALLWRSGILCSLTDPFLEVLQDWKSNHQNENNPQQKEMKQTTVIPDNASKLAFPLIPAAPWRELCGDYCSQRLCFLTQARQASTLWRSVIHLPSIWKNSWQCCSPLYFPAFSCHSRASVIRQLEFNCLIKYNFIYKSSLIFLFHLLGVYNFLSERKKDIKNDVQPKGVFLRHL